MKTKNQKIEASAPASVQPSSVSKTSKTGGKKQLPPINFDERRQNRALPTSKVLDLLATKLPDVYALAEVVGKWIFVHFTAAPAADIRRQLATVGFHWNRVRQSWQHPCGIFRDKRAPYDPRKKYGSYFAADIKPA